MSFPPRFKAARRHGEGQDPGENASYWFGRDLMKQFGYGTWEPFEDTIRRAIDLCTILEISVADNFIPTTRGIKGLECDDYRLSAVACCLVALNGDTMKSRVAAARALLRRSEQSAIAEVVVRY